jgi:pheromone shutdown protein TraB
MSNKNIMILKYLKEWASNLNNQYPGIITPEYLNSLATKYLNSPDDANMTIVNISQAQDDLIANYLNNHEQLTKEKPMVRSLTKNSENGYAIALSLTLIIGFLILSAVIISVLIYHNIIK